MATDYPVGMNIDYPDRKLSRLTSFFRIFTVIPILIILELIMYNGVQFSGKDGATAATGLGLVVLPLVLMLLFRKKYPKWWYEWNLNLSMFAYRVASYFYLMTDVYPSTDEEQNVHLEMPYPDASGLNRWLPLVKWFLAIPHIFVLIFLNIAAVFVIIITWFAILFTGKFPRGLFDYLLGVMRWNFRVMSYALIMITDRYPPFSLQA